MIEFYLNELKNQMETALRELLNNSLQEAKKRKIPELMHGMLIMNRAGNFCKGMKEDYPRLKSEYENASQDKSLSLREYNKLVDDVTSKVLEEFVDLPPNVIEDREEDYLY